MFRYLTYALVATLVMASMLLSSCSVVGLGAPTPTEAEILIEPPVGEGAEGTFIPTPTLRPTSTPTPTLEASPTPTNTLDPYNALIFEGIQLRSEEKHEEALAKFNEAIQMDPANPKGYIERGIQYSILDNQDQAITDFNYAINFDPNSAAAYNGRGVAFMIKDQFEQAIKDFTKAIELDPTFSKPYANRATAYILQKQVEPALADFNKYVELFPDDPEGYFNRGQAYLTANEITGEPSYLDLCIADFTQVIAMIPETADASYFNRALCRIAKGDLEEAYADLSQAIAINPEDAKYYLWRTTLYPFAGTLEEALSDARKAAEIAQDEEIRQEAQKALADIPTRPTLTPTPSP